MPQPRKGAAVAQKDSEEAAKARGRSRIDYFIMKKGDKPALLRFITDFEYRDSYPFAIVSAKTHAFAATKPKPDSYKGDKWPETIAMTICANDDMFRVLDENSALTDIFEDGYGNCYIHNRDRGKPDKFGKDGSIPSDQVYGLAVLREPVFDPASGAIVGIKDVYHDWKDAEGTVHKIPKIVLVSQKYTNFWAGAVATAYMEPRTICDKDFKVTRVDNDYTVAVAGMPPNHKPGSPSWQVYFDALKVMDFDLDTYLIERASPDHYARWFDPDREPAGGYGRREDSSDGDSPDDAPAESTSASAPAYDQDMMAEFQGQLSTRGKPANAS